MIADRCGAEKQLLWRRLFFTVHRVDE